MFMDRERIKKSALVFLLLVCLVFVLSGCRARTSGSGAEQAASNASSGIAAEDARGETVSDGSAFYDAPSAQGKDGNLSEQTQENPEAQRKEYDETAPAEIVAGTARLLHAEGEGSGAALPGEDTGATVSRLNSEAEEPATQTVAAEQADKQGVSEDAEAAESALTYFSVLLRDRLESVYECQRANLYWETKQDHVTVHKSSPEHALILDTGAYDVSSRLLSENLRVDDGWVARKNPQVIVKIVDRSVLGGGVLSDGAAKAVYQSLLSREGWAGIDAIRSRQVLLLSEELLEAPHLQTAAMLMIAKTANAALFEDVDLSNALRMLTEEATGAIPTGIFYFSAKEDGA